MVNTDDLCDAHEVADIVGLGHSNTVHSYLRRYPDMPRPVFSLGSRRVQLWLRPEVVEWAGERRRSSVAR